MLNLHRGLKKKGRGFEPHPSNMPVMGKNKNEYRTSLCFDIVTETYIGLPLNLMQFKNHRFNSIFNSI